MLDFRGDATVDWNTYTKTWEGVKRKKVGGNKHGKKKGMERNTDMEKRNIRVEINYGAGRSGHSREKTCRQTD